MGTIDEGVLTVDLSGRCSPGGAAIGATVTFTYDAGANTLTDNFGVIWYR